MNDKEKCPKCGKVVGEYVNDGYMNSPIGAIQMAKQVKNDSASHVFIHINRRLGTLCKDCASELFPDGVRYYVTLMNGTHKGQHTCSGGVDNCGTFASRKEAEADAKRMNAKHNGIRYEVTTKEI